MVKNYQHAAMASSAACFASGLVVVKVVLRGANPKNRLNFWSIIRKIDLIFGLELILS